MTNKLNIAILTFSLLLSCNLSANSNSNRPDYHAPIGVMRDHIHKKGEIMTSYRLGYMYMDENRNNRDRLTIDEIDYMTKPTSMTMKMHMFGAMYGVTDKFTLSLMGGFADKEMTQINNDNQTSSMDNKGRLDTKINSSYQFYNNGKDYVQFNFGINIPTGSIKDSNDNGNRLAYPMQMGSGTYDLLPGVSYSAFTNNWSWGGQFNGTFRLGRNNSGYTLGDVYNITAWTARKLNNSFSVSLRFDGKLIDEIKGKDRNINPMTMGMMAGQYMAAPMNPELHNKKQIDALIGINFLTPSGYFKGHRLGLEFGMPAYQRIDGPMLETDYKVTFGWQKTF
jgi:hypothetical protein